MSRASEQSKFNPFWLSHLPSPAAQNAEELFYVLVGFAADAHLYRTARGVACAHTLSCDTLAVADF